MAVSQKRVSIGQKVVFVAAAFVLPIGVLLYLVVANINEFIHFARLETKGNSYQRPLESALDDTQRHQLLARTGAAPAKLESVQARVDRAIGELEGVDQRFGVDLQFTDEGLAKRERSQSRAKNVKAQWQEITAALAKAKGAGKLPDDLDARYAKLVTDIRTMITHCGDTSNLILDPDLDSYYLMDVTLLALPQIQERNVKVTLYGYDVLTRGDTTPAERTQLAVHAAMLEADLERIVASAQTSFNEDQNFYGKSPTLQTNLAPAVASYKEAVAHFIQLTRQASDPAAAKVTPEEYVAAGMKSHDESFRLWTSAVGELDILLSKRIDSYTSRRTWSLASAGLAVLVACFLAFLATLSIVRPLKKLVRTLGPGATLLGSSVERIAQANERGNTTPEEATIICEELGAHADDMRTCVRELESLVHGHPVSPVQPAAPMEVAHA